MKKREIFTMFTILTPAKIVLVSASIYKILKKVFSDEHLATFCHTKERFNELDKNHKH